MTAEEYVVKKLQEAEESVHLQDITISSLRQVINDLEDRLDYVLSLIEDGTNSQGIRTFNLCIWESYDKEKFDKLLAIKEGDTF